MRISILVGLNILLAISATFAAEAPIGLDSLLGEMIDRDALARWPEQRYQCLQVSSHDRRTRTPDDAESWFANTDNMEGLGADLKRVTIDGRKEWVWMDVDGPGAVVRFWSTGPDPRGTVRVYLDGAGAPVLEGAVGDLLGGKLVIPSPLAIEHARGWNCYLPIPYAKHCLITFDGVNSQNADAAPPARYFNIECRTYPQGTAVRTLTKQVLADSAERIREVCAALADPPKTAGGSAGETATVEPKKSHSMTLPAGPRAVRELKLKFVGVAPDDMERALRSLVLTMTCDGEQTIWSPVGDFFGCGVGLNPVKDWYRTVDADGMMTCLWVMPYRKDAEVGLLNLGDKAVEVDMKATTSRWKWDDRSMYFHANWRQQRMIPTRPYQDWNYISIEGKGRYLGDTLALFNPVTPWWGEGDEKIWVDGEKFPSHIGTGSEDYYGYAWSTPQVFHGPFSNQPRVGPRESNGHVTNTRVRSLDAVPYEKTLRFDMEIWHWAETKVDYAATTYWYALPGAKSNRGAEEAEAAAQIRQLPAKRRLAGALECEKLKVVRQSEGLPVEMQAMEPFGGSWSDDAQLFVRGRGVGDFVELAIPATDGKARRLTLHGTRSFDYGVLRFSVNRRRAGEDYDAYNATVVGTGPIDLGVCEPKDGQFVLRVEVVGGNPQSKGSRAFFGLDCVVLSAEPAP